MLIPITHIFPRKENQSQQQSSHVKSAIKAFNQNPDLLTPLSLMRKWLQQFWLKEGKFSASPIILAEFLKQGNLGHFLILPSSDALWVKSKNPGTKVRLSVYPPGLEDFELVKLGSIVKVVYSGPSDDFDETTFDGYPFRFYKDQNYNYQFSYSVNPVAGIIQLPNNMEWFMPKLTALCPHSLIQLANEFGVLTYTTPVSPVLFIVYEISLSFKRNHLESSSQTFAFGKGFSFLSPEIIRTYQDIMMNVFNFSSKMFKYTYSIDHKFSASLLKTHSYPIPEINDIQDIIHRAVDLDDLLTICGPHGIGKSTLKGRLEEKHGWVVADIDDFYKFHSGLVPADMIKIHELANFSDILSEPRNEINATEFEMILASYQVLLTMGQSDLIIKMVDKINSLSLFPEIILPSSHLNLTAWLNSHSPSVDVLLINYEPEFVASVRSHLLQTSALEYLKPFTVTRLNHEIFSALNEYYLKFNVITGGYYWPYIKVALDL